MDLLYHIVRLRIPLACIFEDDIVVHSRWHSLAPQYMALTPRDWEVIFIGNQPDAAAPNGSRVATQPVFCRHAYAITLSGATKMLQAFKTWTTQSPWGRQLGCLHKGDIMLKDLQTASLASGQLVFKWYNWNGTMEPDGQWNTPFDPQSRQIIAPPGSHKQRNYGLIFQSMHISCADTKAFLKEFQNETKSYR